MFAPSWTGKPYLDFTNPSNLVTSVEKDDDNMFNLEVTKKEVLSHDTYLYRLKFPNPEWISGLWPAGHVFLNTEVNGKRM